MLFGNLWIWGIALEINSIVQNKATWAPYPKQRHLSIPGERKGILNAEGNQLPHSSQTSSKPTKASMRTIPANWRTYRPEVGTRSYPVVFGSFGSAVGDMLELLQPC